MDHIQSELAQSIAAAAHKGQVDKAGKPYIEHPAHVAANVQGDAAKAVAWLHDVVEDTPLTFADLRERGVAPEVIEALKLLPTMNRCRTSNMFAPLSRTRSHVR